MNSKACLHLCFIVATSAGSTHGGMIYPQHAGVTVGGRVDHSYGPPAGFERFPGFQAVNGEYAAHLAGSYLTPAFGYNLGDDGSPVSGTISADWSVAVQKEFDISTGLVRAAVHADVSAELSAGLLGASFTGISLSSNATWNDGVSLEYIGNGSSPLLPPYLRIAIIGNGYAEFKANAALFETFTSIPPMRYHYAHVLVADATLFEYSLGTPLFENEFTLSGIASFDAPLRGGGSSGSANYDASWTVSVGVSTAVGSVGVHSGNTFAYHQILLPDGSTPESQGWQVHFDSGIDSPNLGQSAVPEPTSLSLLTMAGLSWLGVRRFRDENGDSPVRNN